MAPTPKPSSLLLLLRSVAVSCAWGTVLGSIFFSTGNSGSLLGWLVSVGESTTYAVCIGVPATLVFVRLAPRWRGHRPLAQALRYFAVLIPIAFLGCLLADVIFVVAGRREAADLAAQFVADLRVVLMISLMTGTGIIGYERLRDRLEDAQARLREEELARERALRLAADAQLSSLESRIRPHFLFNALNAVLALIPEDPKRAEAVLERLTGLLRASLRVDESSLSSLAEEASLVRDYLEIERARFGDRLAFSINLPPELEATAVPAFGVQTLVENSVKHAVSKRRERTSVRVSARLDGQHVVISVEDDGAGFDGLTLPKGHGLETLRGRIEALFGSAGALDVDASAPGARVTMRLPAKAREAA